MADIVNVGIAGRVYVRFDSGNMDQEALARFRRAGARLDRERNLYFIGEHQREAAEAVVVETFGDLTGKELTKRYEAANGGLPLTSGWVLVSAGSSGIEYRNPYSTNPEAVQLVGWEEAQQAAERAPDGPRIALLELIAAAEALACRRLDRQPFTDWVDIHGNTFPIREQLSALGGYFDKERRVWRVPLPQAEHARKLVEAVGRHMPPQKTGKPATDRQKNALDAMLKKLSRLPDEGKETAEEYRGKIDDMGGWNELSLSQASALIDEIGGEIAERE